jgi:hypothetical protein
MLEMSEAEWRWCRGTYRRWWRCCRT